MLKTLYIWGNFLTIAVHLIENFASRHQPCPIISSLHQKKEKEYLVQLSLIHSEPWWMKIRQGNSLWFLRNSFAVSLDWVRQWMPCETTLFRVVVLSTHSKNMSLISRKGNIIPNTYIVSRSIASFPSTSTFQIPSNTPAKDSLKMEMVFTFKQRIWSQDVFYC